MMLFKSPIWSKGNFVRLWLAQSISLIGDQIYLLALPLLVYDLTKSGSQMSIVFAVEMLPFLFFSVLGGVVFDKWGHKPSLVFGNMLAALPLLAVFALYASGQLEVWHIYISSFLLSCIVATVLPAFEAAIPNILPKEDLISANSLTEFTSSATFIFGPAIAGGLIAFIGSGNAVLLNAISFLVAGVIFALVKIGERAKRSRETARSLLKSFAEGIAYVPGHRILRWGVFMSTTGNIVLGAYNAVLIFYMRDKLGVSATVIGVVLTVSNVVPLIVSGLVASHLGMRFQRGLLMVACLALQGVGVLFVGLSGGLGGLIVAQAVYTGALTLYTINWRTLRQTVTPNTMIGRVSGVCRGIAYAGASLGGFMGGALLTRIEPSTLFVINGSIIVLIALVAMLSPIVSSEANEEAADAVAPRVV